MLKNKTNPARGDNLLQAHSFATSKNDSVWKNAETNETFCQTNFQLGFRDKHSTIEKIHRTIATTIERALENKEVCEAALFDVSQAFDKVRHSPQQLLSDHGVIIN